MQRRSSRHAARALATLALVLTACDGTTPFETASTTPSQVPRLAKASARPTGTGIGVIGSNVDRVHQPVEYHGGPVMLGVTNVYFIWYGLWGGSTTPAILADLVQNLGGSAYFEAVTRYPNATGIAPMNAVQYSGAYFDWFSRGTSLSSTDVLLVAVDAIASGNLPSDPNGVYVVLTSANVAETSGFGTAYCGFHNQVSVNGMIAQTIFVGHPGRAPAQCMPQQVSPNGDSAADAMASVFVNELFDTITDPGFTAWYDRFALEAADKCAWDFGKTYRTSTGARANIQLGARDYLLQRLWNPSGKGSCTLDVNVTSY